jgi:3-oxoadipate enol-lactonase
MQFARLNGANIHYQVIGAPEGKPVLVFSNSLGTDFRIWRDVIVALAGDFAIITYDKRGHGLSDVGDADFSMDLHVADLEALLDHLSVKRATICGLSVGGLIAQGLYQKRPELVSGLILCDTGHVIGTAKLWNERIATINANGIGALAGAIFERWFTPAFRSPANPAFAGYANMLTRTPREGYLGTAAAIRDTDYTEAAGAIAVKTLCVVGDQDGATPPALVRELASLIPEAQFEIIADAGHLPCIEQPQALVALIRGFFTTPVVDITTRH